MPEVKNSSFDINSPCPRCDQKTLIGIMLVDEKNEHQHTYYMCRLWRSGIQNDGTCVRTVNCDWSGWVVPGYDD